MRKHGFDVIMLEAAPRLGGLSVAAQYPGFVWDRFYHVILPSDLHLIELLGEIGLGDELVWTPTSQGIFMDGSIHPMKGALDLLRLPRLSMWEKFRLGWMAAFLFLLCAALRLARFNVTKPEIRSHHFIGLPSPAAAVVVASIVIAFEDLFATRMNPFIMVMVVYTLLWFKSPWSI